MPIKLTLEEFISKANLIHNHFYTYEHFIYINTHTSGLITCPIHGDFKQTPHSHLKGYGCPYCSGCHPSNTKEFILKANSIHDCFYTYDHFSYINNNTKGLITCPIHGDFLQTPHCHLAGQGCPECRRSKGAIKVLIFLKKHNINFEKEKKFIGCISKKENPLRFDFYLPKFNICIEYDGEQHFKSSKFFGGNKKLKNIQENDQIKNQYCIDNNIKLIRIKYNQKVENVLNEELLSFIT